MCIDIVEICIFFFFFFFFFLIANGQISSVFDNEVSPNLVYLVQGCYYRFTLLLQFLKPTCPFLLQKTITLLHKCIIIQLLIKSFAHLLCYKVKTA